MPFREKSCWASLTAITLGYGVYFAILIPRFSADPAPPHYLGLLFACLIGLVVLQIVLQTALALSMRSEANLPADERERLIGMKSDRIAMIVMATLIGGLWWAYVTSPAFVANGAILANLILFGLVVAAIAKYASAIVYFHKGA